MKSRLNHRRILLKQGLSSLAGVSLFWLRGWPTHDATNAFKIYDQEMLKSFNIESTGGFELNLELTVKPFWAGYLHRRNAYGVARPYRQRIAFCTLEIAAVCN